MGYRIKKVNVFTGDLANNQLLDSASIFIRGAAFVFFHIAATSASQLAANTIIKTSLNGTNFVSTSSSTGLNGGCLSSTSGIITTALNTGGVIASLKLGDVSPGGSDASGPACHRALKALLTMQAPAGGLAGLTVDVFVGYEYDGETAIVSFADNIGPNV